MPSPFIIEKTPYGETRYDVYSRLLKDRIIFLGEEIDDEVIVVANSQQYKSSSFTKIDGGNQVDIKATVTKVN